jgi:23S rRNA pseudouridine1911/1915/1917 synthase
LDLDEDAHPADLAESLELEVEHADSGERLDKWVAGQLAQFSRTRLQLWIEQGWVLVNGERATTRQTVFGSDRVTIWPQRSEEANAFVPEPMALPIVFEDADLMVLDKPAGLVVHPAAGNWQGTLLNGLLHYAPPLAHLPRAGIVHRLDKDTSGLMVVAKTLEVQTSLVRQLQARAVHRDYLAVVHGEPPAAGRIEAPIGRSLRDRKRMAAFEKAGPTTKTALTRFKTLERNLSAPGAGAVALVGCQLETGRTHQIRVHMQWAGFPLVGDPLYGGARDEFPRQALHAWRLEFIHPGTERAVAFTSPPPDDLRALLELWALSLQSVATEFHAP